MDVSKRNQFSYKYVFKISGDCLKAIESDPTIDFINHSMQSKSQGCLEWYLWVISQMLSYISYVTCKD